ncbi:uncharacterized protein CMU_016330 [Cryptosporidium muris RN66]|uniref:Uncharacterized protein n=1 Tax=Cryptosporidium muris (strain RN66) TaxID=441375 RepID=B6ACN0_CRYMR|nr:uncharacterized protein CMU_016330 [Cryptosporidium muris RN66]EEA05884.1 hypothetical protein, conserved [Cryptosporidium muris RN66]|eukprot:XP_002140233.1 hypothetical protein [Cryptosporidium muris RN66]
MARKNNRNKRRAYIDWLRDKERDMREKYENKRLRKISLNKQEVIKSDFRNLSNSTDIKMIKVRKQSKVDKRAQRRLNKLANIKKMNVSMDL